MCVRADEHEYLPRDKDKEAKFSYSLPDSLARNRRALGHGFLHGKRVFVAADVGVADVDLIVKAAEGEFLTALPKKATKDTLVVAVRDSAAHREAADIGPLARSSSIAELYLPAACAASCPLSVLCSRLVRPSPCSHVGAVSFSGSLCLSHVNAARGGLCRLHRL